MGVLEVGYVAEVRTIVNIDELGEALKGNAIKGFKVSTDYPIYVSEIGEQDRFVEMYVRIPDHQLDEFLELVKSKSVRDGFSLSKIEFSHSNS